MTDAAWLCSAPAIRATCAALVEAGTDQFDLVEDRMPAVADYVAAVIRRNHPALDIPHHARWRHFGPQDWSDLPSDPAERARARIDLCVASVLLDAGAGPAWSYRAGGRAYARSEGLAMASLKAFRAGLFGAGGRARVDAEGLSRIDAAGLAQAFQVTAENPLAGLDGRAALLRNLGRALAGFPDGRAGGLWDLLIPGPSAAAGGIAAADILQALLDRLAPIWPARPMGDVWRHPSGAFVAFHKLSQWLAYSLIEAFEDAGVAVCGIDQLTGLPEYRNGGLFIDLGVLRPTFAPRPLRVDEAEVIEWRALTVVLLDRLAPLVNERLGRCLPLSRLLEGGTWAAGRAIAAERRPGGGPPLVVCSDGTVF